MKKIFGALALVIIAALVQANYQYSTLAGFFNLLLLAAFIYFITAIIGYIRKPKISVSAGTIVSPIPSHNANITQPVKPASKPNFKNLLPFVFIIIAILVYVFRESLGQKSFATLVFLDDLLMVSSSINPVVMWCVLGLFIGLIYGSVVALKKYKLTIKVTLVPVAIVIAFLVLMFAANKPLSVPPTILYNTKKVDGYSFINVETTNNKSGRNYSYPVANMLDAKENTSFVFNTSGSANQQISFTFTGTETDNAKNYKCIGFKIKNGNRKSAQTFANFGRLKEFTITASSSNIKPITTIAFDNDSNVQEVSIAPISLKNNDVITVELLSIYPGKKYPTQAAIAELVPVIEYESN